MVIFFDHQTFSLQSYGGVSRYYTELIDGINNTSGNQAKVPLLFSNNIYLREKGINARPFLPAYSFEKRAAVMYRLNKFYTIPVLQRAKFDIFHPTYYDSYFLPYIKKKPFVVTFHDMIHEKFSSQFEELAMDRVITDRKRIVANQADRIIAVSENTKLDVVNMFGISPSKIDVIYQGSSLKPEADLEFTANTTEPYLLFVGNRGHYKNFEGLVTAIHPILRKNRLKLICAGGGSFSNTEKEFIHSLHLDDLLNQQPIDDQSLKFLYKQAVAFVFPSLYEGFGIPILEAFACNCPCIVSNSSSLPEVAGEAALYFNPTEPDSIGNAVETLLHDANLRNVLIQKGRIQVKRFSWQATVDQTLALYKTLV